jgi:hypothetical protein
MVSLRFSRRLWGRDLHTMLLPDENFWLMAVLKFLYTGTHFFCIRGSAYGHIGLDKHLKPVGAYGSILDMRFQQLNGVGESLVRKILFSKPEQCVTASGT